ncbi:MAG: hypothetical protein LBR24_04215 [Methanobrevibacter sp.]|jgi:hypothetical protein|nr:hypothetical protein [Methanobrevibacter sp.]
MGKGSERFISEKLLSIEENLVTLKEWIPPILADGIHRISNSYSDKRRKFLEEQFLIDEDFKKEILKQRVISVHRSVDGDVEELNEFLLKKHPEWKNIINPEWENIKKQLIEGRESENKGDRKTVMVNPAKTGNLAYKYSK